MSALIVIAAAEAVLVAFLLWERHRTSPNQAALIALVDRMAQRIQSPSAAVLEHDEQVRAHRDEEYAPPPVPVDDDQAYWETRDKLAERLMQEEVAGHGSD